MVGYCWVGHFPNYWVFRFPTVAVVVVDAIAVVEAAVDVVDTEADS